MADSVSTHLRGAFELERMLRQLPQKVENKVLQKAVTSAAREGRKIIRAAAPRGDGSSVNSKKYGTLRKNIRVIRLRRVGNGERAARIDTGNAFWGYIYEKGSRHQPARPWFEPAFHTAQEKMLSVLLKTVAAGIEKEARK